MSAIQKKDQTVVVYPFFVLLQQLPKVLEFLLLLEVWAINDEMVLFTMKAARLRGGSGEIDRQVELAQPDGLLFLCDGDVPDGVGIWSSCGVLD